MIRSLSHISRRLYVYQNERFPIILLSLSLLPATLSSVAVVSKSVSVGLMALAFIASLAYIFHIRVNDEERDLEHDTHHHSNRPIQKGIITLNELRIFDYVGLVCILSVAVFSGFEAALIALIMVVYSFAARKDFFCKEKIRRHFFVYNSAHLVQILLMQVFVYAVFSHNIQITALLLTHFLFTMTGTIIFEFARKLKLPGDDGTGMDTYTHHLGFKTSMIVYSVLIMMNASLFLLMSSMISHGIWIYSYIVFVPILMAYTTWVHWVKKSNVTDKLMQGTFLLAYAAYNVIIFILIR